MKNLGTFAPIASAMLAIPLTCSATIVQGGSAAGLDVFTFDSVPNPTAPWTPYQSISGSGFVLGERLTGQATGASSTQPNNEVVSGTPSTPLTIDLTRPFTTGVSVFSGFSSSGDLDMAPEGVLGWSNPDSLGEGAWSVVFGADQSRVAFDVGYGDAANTTQVLFYDRAGNLLGAINAVHPATGVSQFQLVFSVTSGASIAAMTVNNTDPGGLGFDDLRYAVPAPSALTAFASMAVLGLRRRR